MTWKGHLFPLFPSFAYFFLPPHKNICVKGVSSLYHWNCKSEVPGECSLPHYHTSAGNLIHQLVPLACLSAELKYMCVWGWAGKSTPKKNKVTFSLFSCLPSCPCKPPLHRCSMQFDIDANKHLCVVFPSRLWDISRHGWIPAMGTINTNQETYRSHLLSWLLSFQKVMKDAI